MLIRLREYDKEMTIPAPACWIDPATVSCVHPSGVPGCSVVHGSKDNRRIIFGTPDQVVMELFPDTERDGRVARVAIDQSARVEIAHGVAGESLDGEPLPPVDPSPA